MGLQRDAGIRYWQEKAGLKPATGHYRARLERMSQLAFALIKCIELEKSGIRDGYGQWNAADPIGGIVGDLGRLERADVADVAACQATADTTVDAFDDLEAPLEAEELASVRTSTFDDHFGVCPKCHQNDGFLNIWEDHWSVCHFHRVKWRVGSNLFDVWRREDEEIWDRNWRVLETYLPSSRCGADSQRQRPGRSQTQAGDRAHASGVDEARDVGAGGRRRPAPSCESDSLGSGCDGGNRTSVCCWPTRRPTAIFVAPASQRLTSARS